MLDYARRRDTVVVAAIDRLGRSVAEVTRTIAELGDRRITLRTLSEGIDGPLSGVVEGPPLSRNPRRVHPGLTR
jgi:DNA invertase Pin-like site-specific DNA recombinase